MPANGNVAPFDMQVATVGVVAFFVLVVTPAVSIWLWA